MLEDLLIILIYWLQELLIILIGFVTWPLWLMSKLPDYLQHRAARHYRESK